MLLLEGDSLTTQLADKIKEEEDPSVLDGWLKAAKKASSLREFVELAGLNAVSYTHLVFGVSCSCILFFFAVFTI